MNRPACQEFHVIGPGRLGWFFHQVLGGEHGQIYGRGDDLCKITSRAVVAVRIKDLAQVFSQLPDQIKTDLVCVQNGLYESICIRFGCKPTKLLVYFAVNHVGHFPKDQASLSVVTGPYSQQLIRALALYQIHVRAVGTDEWHVLAHEKLIWLSVFGLLGQLYQTHVGQLIRHHRSTCQSLCYELCQLCEHTLGLDFLHGSEGAIKRMMQYSESLGAYEARLKEYDYRNGYFMNLNPTEKHSGLLQQLDASSRGDEFPMNHSG